MSRSQFFCLYNRAKVSNRAKVKVTVTVAVRRKLFSLFMPSHL